MLRVFEGFTKGINLGGWLSQNHLTQEHLTNFITEKDIERILNDHTQNASWLVQRFIDYKEITDNDLSEYLKKLSTTS